MFHGTENIDITELLIQAAELKVVLTTGFKRGGNWNSNIR